MVMNLGGGAPRPPESNEKIKPVEVNFFKLGGTWDMVFRDGQKIGTGNLDDDALKELQTAAGYFSDNPEEMVAADKRLALELYERFQRTEPIQADAGDHLSTWAHTKFAETSKLTLAQARDALRAKKYSAFDMLNNDVKEFIRGPFIPLFSGDSSHLDAQITAPIVATLLQRAMREPTKPLVGGQGTDTADMAILQLYDVFTFDTNLPPLILAGANRSHVEEDSDAPNNFIDAAWITHLDLPTGAYWVFQGNIYKGSDVVKIDPTETRKVEGQSTFYSPHQQNIDMSGIFKQYGKSQWETRAAPPGLHIIHKVTVENLYDALESIYNPDLGRKDSVPRIVIPGIHNPANRAIVIAAHSLGNTGNGIRNACIKEALQGKPIVGISRTLVGATNEEYAASLFGANKNPQELGGTGKQIIYGHKINSAVANALMTRALLENLDQAKTQELFTKYAQSRSLA